MNRNRWPNLTRPFKEHEELSIRGKEWLQNEEDDGFLTFLEISPHERIQAICVRERQRREDRRIAADISSATMSGVPPVQSGTSMAVPPPSMVATGSRSEGNLPPGSANEVSTTSPAFAAQPASTLSALPLLPPAPPKNTRSNQASSSVAPLTPQEATGAITTPSSQDRPPRAKRIPSAREDVNSTRSQGE